MKRVLQTLFFICFITQFVSAQKEAPKWLDKNKRAVFTIITYDKDNNIVSNGNGFYISEDGIACADYTLFKGAERAVIINSEEKQLPVKNIMGVNEMYDIIKFRVEIDKKVIALASSSTPAKAGDEVFLLPYSSKKEKNFVPGKVESNSPIQGGYQYYSIQMPYADKNISCPVVTNSGEVIGILQKNAPGETDNCYTLDIAFIKSLTFNALNLNNNALNSIGIKKALPETEDQALVYLYLRSGGLNTEEYLNLLNEFLEQFPNSSEGYIRRATHYAIDYTGSENLAKTEQDILKAEKTEGSKDNLYFNYAKIIYTKVINTPDLNYKDWSLDKALAENAKALALDSLPLYIQQRGDIYFAKKEYEKAYEVYERVNQTNLKSPATYYSAAKAKEMAGGSGNEIVALLDSAISLFSTPLPADAAPYFFERAERRVSNGMPREAVEDYDQYYNIVNGQVNDVFYYYREQANYQAKNFLRALEDIQKAIEINPKDVTYLAELGAVNIRIAKYEDAIKSLKDALAIDPNFAACYRLIGFCQIQLKQESEACVNFTKAKELGDEAVNSLIERYCKGK